jgi:hypothetical protein
VCISTTYEGKSMKTMRLNRLTALVASAILLGAISSAAWAGGHKSPKPFEVDFDKCFAHNGPAPYIVTFSGPVSGDVSGSVDASVFVYMIGIEPNSTHIQADYFVTGSLPFTARVGGRVNDKNRQAVLRGYVSEGPVWLMGAGVHDEFLGYTRADGTPCAKGTLYITPRWKQTHNDDND